MTAPHLASDNSRIAVAEASKLANAERALHERVATFLTRPPLRDHLDRLIEAAVLHRELRITELAEEREARAEAVRVVR